MPDRAVILDEPPEWAIACPKCKSLPGWPCQSIIHAGGLATRVYRTHKKRRTAHFLGGRLFLVPLGIMIRSNLHGPATFVRIP
jgi:hypothetical protein